jgi:hypothetical protein
LELPELLEIASRINELMKMELSNYSGSAQISYPESPNPVCVIQLEGPYSVVFKFWANDEYAIEAFENCRNPELYSEQGVSGSAERAMGVFRDFFKTRSA